MTCKGKMAAACVPFVSANVWIFFHYLRYYVKFCLHIQQQNVKYKFIYCTMYLFSLGIGPNSWCTLYMGRTFQVSKGNFSGAYYTRWHIIIGKLQYAISSQSASVVYSASMSNRQLWELFVNISAEYTVLPDHDSMNKPSISVSSYHC